MSHQLAEKGQHRRDAASASTTCRPIPTVREPPNLVILSNLDFEIAAVTDWLTPFKNQDFSFADAVSFAVMKARRIKHALTLDHHFAVAGFTTVPG